MNKVIHKKNIRYIKLCLISPLFELIINFVYIVSFLILSFKYFNMGRNFSNYKITQMTSDYLGEKTFNQIQTDTDFIAYLVLLLNNLYTLDPIDPIPIMIPLGSIRLIKYTGIAQECSEKINKNPCSNCMYFLYCNRNLDDCVINTLEALYKDSTCGQPYKRIVKKNTTTTPIPSNIATNTNTDGSALDPNLADPFEGLISKYQGYYTSYDLFSDGEQIDITIDEYINNQHEYDQFITDPDLKCK